MEVTPEQVLRMDEVRWRKEWDRTGKTNGVGGNQTKGLGSVDL